MTRWSAFCQPPNSYTTSWDSTRRGWTAVSRITASTSAVRAPAWRWGFESRLPHPFKEARTPGSRQGDSSLDHSWALAMAEVARRRVAMLAPKPARTAR